MSVITSARMHVKRLIATKSYDVQKAEQPRRGTLNKLSDNIKSLFSFKCCRKDSSQDEPVLLVAPVREEVWCHPEFNRSTESLQQPMKMQTGAIGLPKRRKQGPDPLMWRKIVPENYEGSLWRMHINDDPFGMEWHKSKYAKVQKKYPSEELNGKPTDDVVDPKKLQSQGPMVWGAYTGLSPKDPKYWELLDKFDGTNIAPVKRCVATSSPESVNSFNEVEGSGRRKDVNQYEGITLKEPSKLSEDLVYRDNVDQYEGIDTPEWEKPEWKGECQDSQYVYPECTDNYGPQLWKALYENHIAGMRNERRFHVVHNAIKEDGVHTQIGKAKIPEKAPQKRGKSVTENELTQANQVENPDDVMRSRMVDPSEIVRNNNLKLLEKINVEGIARSFAPGESRMHAAIMEDNRIRRNIVNGLCSAKGKRKRLLGAASLGLHPLVRSGNAASRERHNKPALLNSTFKNPKGYQTGKIQPKTDSTHL